MVRHPLQRLKINRARSAAAPCIVAGWLLLAGCGGEPQLVPVTGKVLYNGSPVAGAAIMFYPENGRPATATTDDEGRFALMTSMPGDGAFLGKHRVTVTKNVERMPPSEENPYPTFRNTLPAKYQLPDTSGLTATVTTDGDNEFVFELED